jgi:hypothetical protein
MSDNEDTKKELALQYLNVMTRDPDLVEIATGWRQTFAISSVNKVAPSNKTISDFSRNINPQYIKQVQKAWAELLELSTSQIKEAIEQKEEQLQQEKENSYLFNQPDALFIDLDFWARAATWTDEQAVMLSLNRHPEQKYLDCMKALSLTEIQKSELAMNFFDRVALVAYAKEAGQISKEGKAIDFVAWFKQMEFDVRADLIEQVKRFQTNTPNLAPDQEKQLTDRERETLLKLIAAMAVKGYRFDPNMDRNAATADIRGDLELLGFPMDNKTILKWLRAATDLVDKDYWDKS